MKANTPLAPRMLWGRRGWVHENSKARTCMTVWKCGTRVECARLSDVRPLTANKTFQP